MLRVGLWQVTGTAPVKLKEGGIDLESHLEGWIEKDPSLLQAGLAIVGRQTATDAGPLDLLAIDGQGRWTVIEIKKGPVHRETIAQALDYAACIATLPYMQLSEKVSQYLATSQRALLSLDAILEQRGGIGQSEETPREVRTLVVGTGRAPGLDRLADYLSTTYGVPIGVATFSVFRTSDGQTILVRDLLEERERTERADGPTVESVCVKADLAGVGEPFREILGASRELGVYPRPWKGAIMYAPPANRSRCLFTAWVPWPSRAGMVPVWVQADAFPQFYPVTEDVVKSYLGDSGYQYLLPAEVPVFIEKLRSLFRVISNLERDEPRQEQAVSANPPVTEETATIAPAEGPNGL